MRTDSTNLFKIFIKRLWIIILLPSIAMLTAGYLSYYVLKPVYESSVTLIVVNSQNSANQNDSSEEYYNLLIGKQLVNDYEEIIKSRAITETVIKELNIKNITPAGLAKRITVEAKNDTSIIEIKVKGNSPNEAKMIAEKISAAFEERVFALFKNKSVSIIDGANIPDSFIYPKTKMNIILAAVAGLFMAFLIVLFIDYFDDRVKTTEELEERLGLPVLGIIPDLNMK